jgi:transcriptional regulator with XRE-family HTH domain
MTKSIHSIGETLRTLREEKNLPLRKVAHQLDIDQSFLSKIERNEKRATKDQIIQLAKIFKVDEQELLLQYNSDKVLYEIMEEKNPKEILKIAEEKINYYKKAKA